MKNPTFFAVVALLTLLAWTEALAAAGLDVRVEDGKGEAVDQGVVEAVPVGGTSSGRVGTSPGAGPGTGIMDQIQEAFVPYVLAVPVGTLVSFPNQDNIRHHVYSFSEAKKFELPLYKGTPAKPVLMDRPGVVVLGCNIHDQMRGYIYVAQSPHFAQLGEDGKARLDGLPAGEYDVRVWHPMQKTEASAQRIRLAGEGSQALAFTLELKPSLRRRGSAAAGKKY